MSIETSWDSLRLGELVGDDVVQVINALDTVVSTLVNIIDVAAVILDLVATLVVEDVDLTKAAIIALVEAIDAATTLLTSTSVNLAVYVPKSYLDAPSLRVLLNKFSASLTDTSDPNRPTGEEGNHFLMWFVIGVGPNYKEVNELLREFISVLGRDLEESPVAGDSQFDDAMSEGEWPPDLSDNVGMEPNWDSLRLSDLRVFRSVVDSLLAVRESVGKIGSNVEQLRQRISLIQKRAAYLAELIDRAREALETAQRVAQSVSGLHSLLMRGTGSISDQQQALQLSKSLEGFPEGQGAEVAGGVCFHLQAGTGGLIDTFLGIFGIAQRGSSLTVKEAFSVARNLTFIDVDEAMRRGWHE